MSAKGRDHQVPGFKFASAAAGIKRPGKPDLALIYSEVPAVCAGVFTRNQMMAAPLTVSRPRVRTGSCQAILVNSGNANACTGEPGQRDALRCSQLAAAALGIPEEAVIVSSTGVIGVPLPMEKFERHVPSLPAELRADGAAGAARAIMTTDAFEKISFARSEGEGYAVLGIAKGAGMIHPDMATMLAFVLTDARVAPDFLQASLESAVAASFNSISVDGDTSTNDMVVVLANGLGGQAEIVAGTPAGDEFQALLGRVLLDLAKMIVRDGEGATKLVTIEVQGARDDAQARLVARSIATSNLVKTAFFGEDANWGRIIAAVGYAGADVDPERVAIFFDQVAVAREGLGIGGPDTEAAATAVMKNSEFTVRVDLGLGAGEGRYYTSDLTYDYVKINADYRT